VLDKTEIFYSDILVHSCGLEFWWRRDFSHSSGQPLGRIQLVYCILYTRLFPGLYRSGRSVNHLLPSNAEVKERLKLYLYFPLCIHGRLEGKCTFLIILYIKVLQSNASRHVSPNQKFILRHLMTLAYWRVWNCCVTGVHQLVKQHFSVCQFFPVSN
jgi:hypothetical protein